MPPAGRGSLTKRLVMARASSMIASLREIGVVADLFGLPEVAAFVTGYVRQAGAQGYFGPLERPEWSLGSGQVEAVGFLNELA